MKEMAASSSFFFRDPQMDEKAVAKRLAPDACGVLDELKATLALLGRERVLARLAGALG